MTAVIGQLFILPSTEAAMGWRAVFSLGAVVNVLLVNGDEQQVKVFLLHQHSKLLTLTLLFLLLFYPQYSSLLLSFISSFFLSIFYFYLLLLLVVLISFHFFFSPLLFPLPVISNTRNVLVYLRIITIAL